MESKGTDQRRVKGESEVDNRRAVYVAQWKRELEEAHDVERAGLESEVLVRQTVFFRSFATASPSEPSRELPSKAEVCREGDGEKEQAGKCAGAACDPTTDHDGNDCSEALNYFGFPGGKTRKSLSITTGPHYRDAGRNPGGRKAGRAGEGRTDSREEEPDGVRDGQCEEACRANGDGREKEVEVRRHGEGKEGGRRTKRGSGEMEKMHGTGWREEAKADERKKDVRRSVEAREGGMGGARNGQQVARKERAARRAGDGGRGWMGGKGGRTGTSAGETARKQGAHWEENGSRRSKDTRDSEARQGGA
ncbi:hypothetical protein FB451DRAFT_1362730 [Mycena latifolia]|nr:hypothetical protein FB451DRAFT_1362730 [Mycena latifolia]